MSEVNDILKTVDDIGLGIFLNSHEGDKIILEYFPETELDNTHELIKGILNCKIIFPIDNNNIINGKGKEYLEIGENNTYRIKIEIIREIKEKLLYEYLEFQGKLNGSINDDKRTIKFVSINNFDQDSCRMQSARDGYNHFYCNTTDVIIGKPIAIDQNLKTVTLITTTVRYDKENIPHYNHFFIGDIIDFRRAGSVHEELIEDFFMYSVIYKKKKYLLLCNKELSEEEHKFTGCIINVGDFSEISKTLKLKGKTPLFFMYKSEASVETLEKEDIIKYVEEANINSDEFLDLVFLRKENTEYEIYRQLPEVEKLVVAQLLSGKVNGYPLHSLHIGNTGTGKSFMGEAVSEKFGEEEGIYEAGSATLKGLIPSFKSNPMAPGYILKCNRFAIVDELLKMIERTITQNKEYFSNHLGQMNMLLEQKYRTIGSGNDNNVAVKTTAKCMFLANPVKENLLNHLGTLDISTLARMIIYCQNSEKHREFIQNNAVKPIKSASIYKEIDKKRYIHTQLYVYTQLREVRRINDKYDTHIVVCVYISFFKTIYDSCQIFVVKYDMDRLKTIFNTISNSLTGNLKTLFDSRHMHHIILLLDGIVKFRCIFEDKDPTYTPIEKDYMEVEELMKFITESWKIEFDPIPGVKEEDENKDDSWKIHNTEVVYNGK